MITNTEARKIIIKALISKERDFIQKKDITPQHFIELFDRELNCGIHILRDDCNKILNNKLNGSWIIRRASIKANDNMFPFVISYKYFNIYNYIFCYIKDKGIYELDPRYYNGGDKLPDSYELLKIKNTHFNDMFEIFEHYGLTLSYKTLNKLSNEIKKDIKI